MKTIKPILAAGCFAMGLAGTAGAADIVHQSFGSVGFTTARISTNESNFLKLPNEWAKTYGSYNKSLAVPPQIAEMVRLRVSQMNQCDYCSVFHTKDALETGLVPPKVYSIATWRSSGLFSKKERAALGYAEALSSLDGEAIQGAYENLEAVGFTVIEKEELTNITILMDVWARVFLAQGKTSHNVTPAPKQEAAEKAAQKPGK